MSSDDERVQLNVLFKGIEMGFEERGEEKRQLLNEITILIGPTLPGFSQV
jgi:hypothetical protein